MNIEYRRYTALMPVGDPRTGDPVIWHPVTLLHHDLAQAALSAQELGWLIVASPDQVPPPKPPTP